MELAHRKPSGPKTGPELQGFLSPITRPWDQRYSPRLRFAIHFCRIACWSCSMLVNVTPMPILGRMNTTLPRAVNVAPSWEMRTRTSVPCGVGFSMSRKHPPRLRSLVLAASFVSDEISIASASAMNGYRGERRRSESIRHGFLCGQSRERGHIRTNLKFTSRLSQSV